MHLKHASLALEEPMANNKLKIIRKQVLLQSGAWTS